MVQNDYSSNSESKILFSHKCIRASVNRKKKHEYRTNSANFDSHVLIYALVLLIELNYILNLFNENNDPYWQ